MVTLMIIMGRSWLSWWLWWWLWRLWRKIGKVEILIMFWETCYDNKCSTMTTTNMQDAFFLKISRVPVIQGTWYDHTGLWSQVPDNTCDPRYLIMTGHLRSSQNIPGTWSYNWRLERMGLGQLVPLNLLSGSKYSKLIQHILDFLKIF